MIFFFLVFLLSTNINFSLGSKNVSLSEVALFIVRDHFGNLTSTVVVGEESVTPESSNTNELLLEYILQHLDGRIAVQFLMDVYFFKPMEYHIFIVDSFEAFKKLHQCFADKFYERHFRFLIVFTKFPHDFWNIMTDIFVLCYKINVIDVNILVDTTDGVLMYTHYLFSETTCHKCVPALLYNFNEGLENLKYVFPKKLKNLHGCPIKVSSRDFPPYLSFEGNIYNPKPVGAWENLKGMEGNLLKLLARHLNFTIDLQPFPVKPTYIISNRAYGCLKELEYGNADMAIGGLGDSRLARSMFSPTKTYHSSNLKFIVRLNPKISSWARLVKPFSLEVWLIVAAFVALTIIVMSVLRIKKPKVFQFIFGKRTKNPVTNFLLVFLGFPVKNPPGRNFARYYFVQLLLLTIILRNAYQGFLFDAIRTDRLKITLRGHDDLHKWNYTLKISRESFLFLDEPSTKRYLNERVSALQTLEELDGKVAVLVVQDAFIYYSKNNIRRLALPYMLLPENIVQINLVIFLPKHSIYLNSLNEKITQVVDSGIMKKLSYDPALDEKLYIRHYFNEQSKKLPLRNTRIYAVYCIGFALMGVSVVVFCLEVLSVNYFKKLQRIFL